jgi:hypothetical protein
MSLDVPEPLPQPSEMPYDPDGQSGPVVPVQQPYGTGTEDDQQPGP